MKNIISTILFSLVTIIGVNAQYFIGTLEKEDAFLIFKIKPVLGGGDITTGFSNMDFFLRVPTPTNIDDWGVPEINTVDFPDMTGLFNYNGEDVNDTESGYTNYNWGMFKIGSEIESTYSEDTEYEVFRVEAFGNASVTFDTEFITTDSDTDDPYYFRMFGSGTDLVDIVGNDYFYGTTGTGNSSNGDNTWFETEESAALPIIMKSFTAVPFENRDANLDWVTASEVNGSHFDVERSDDGVNFTQIGRVEAAGNSSTDQEYKFSDREINMERNDVVQYYRIKMVDIDGEYKYSGVRVVNFTRSDIEFTINAFPNPAVNYVQLELTGLDNTSTERPMLNVYSNTGELIRAEVLNSDLGKIDMSNLPSSLYHFIIDYKGQRYTEKVILIK